MKVRIVTDILMSLNLEDMMINVTSAYARQVGCEIAERAFLE